MAENLQLPTDPAEVHSLWLTSRSTFERGTQHCPFARYVDYHAGPFGYGFSRKAMSLPLVTGTYAHLGITSILQWCLDARLSSGHQPDEAPDEVIRWAAELAVESYRAVCTKRGILTYAQDNPEDLTKLQYLIKEQEFLIEGLTWSWALQRLPSYLREYVIVEVEGEQEYVVDCSCGIGDGVGTFAEHAVRHCNGIGLQSKPDCLGERRSDHKYGYTEFKTAGIADKGLNESWERKQQFILGMLGAERRHGVEVSHAWVEVLVKGKREKEPPYGPEQPKLQMSPLCMAYYGAPNPPTSEGEWKPQYYYFDREGIKHTASRPRYRKTALWEPAELEAWPGKPAEMSISEYWVKTLLVEFPTHIAKTLSLVGPIPKQREMVDKALRSLVGEERLWQERLGKIYEFHVATGKEWGDDDFMAFVETVVPRSWHCDPFAAHPCSNQPICHPVTEDWREPVARELYVYRVPHHQAELDQVKSRGLAPEEGFGQEDDETENPDE